MLFSSAMEKQLDSMNGKETARHLTKVAVVLGRAALERVTDRFFGKDSAEKRTEAYFRLREVIDLTIERKYSEHKGEKNPDDQEVQNKEVIIHDKNGSNIVIMRKHEDGVYSIDVVTPNNPYIPGLSMRQSYEIPPKSADSVGEVSFDIPSPSHAPFEKQAGRLNTSNTFHETSPLTARVADKLADALTSYNTFESSDR